MVPRDLRLRVERRLRAAGVSQASDQLAQLCSYFGLLAKWNAKLNLTGLTLEPPANEAIDRLIVEPCVAAQALQRSDSFLLDLGSGGGSPAIPLKICAPSLRLVMVEAKARKAAFLRDAIRQLKLDGADVANSRFEDLLARPEFHEAADVVSIRAVRADRTLWIPTMAFLKREGRVFWFGTANSPAPVVGAALGLDSVTPLPGAGQLFILRKVA